MSKVLDETGLAYFWSKIKDYVDSATGGGYLSTSDIINALTSTATDKVLSAAQGKALNDKVTMKSATLNMGSLQVTNTTNGRWNGSATRTVQGGDNNPYLSAPTGTSNTANCIYVKKSGYYLVSLVCRFSAVTNANNVKFITLWDVTAGGTAGLGAIGRPSSWEDLSSTEITYLTAGHYYTLGGRVEDGNCTISSSKASFVALE